MSTASETYEAMISQFDTWEKLKGFWQAIRNGDTPAWPVGKAFEYLVLQAFRLDGGTIRWPYNVTVEQEIVEQIDGVVHIGRFSCVVESKHTSRPLAIAPIAKLRNQLLRRHSGTIGLIFSYAGFTPPALLLARYIAPQAILLWNGSELEQVLEDRQIGKHLESKYQASIETGIPDASILRSPESLSGVLSAPAR